MDIDELKQHAAYNREVFDRVLAPYVAAKITNVAHALDHGAHNVWLDASGCVWCLFDGPDFMRSGDEAQALTETQDDSLDLQVFWSLGNVVMPGACDAQWVAKRIAQEALRQLPKLGFHRRMQSREIEGERHEGVLFAKTIFRLR